MPTLTAAADEVLSGLSVKTWAWAQLGTWNVGEYSFLMATLTNNTGRRLYDATVEVRLSPYPSYGSVLPVQFVSDARWDGNGAFVSSLGPGESVDLVVAFLVSVSAGFFTWRPWVQASMTATGSQSIGAGGTAIYP